MPSPSRRARSRFPLLVGVGLGLLVLVLGAALLAYGMLQNYLRGERFRRLVERQAGQWLRADVTMAPLTWTSATVYVDRAGAEGEPESVVESLAAESLRTGVNVRALLAREVSFEPIEITRLTVELKPPLARASSSPPSPSPPPAPAAWWQPRKVELGGVQVNDLQLDSPWVGLSGTRALLEPGSTRDFTFKGGRMRLPGLPEASLNQARIRLTSDSMHLLSCDVALGGGGAVDGEGVVGWSEASAVDLRVRWSQVKLEHFLPANWRPVLQGHTAGNVRYLRQAGGVVLNGSIRSENASVGVLPLLKVLADFTGSERFAQVPLQELAADFTREGEALELKNVVVESSGLIRLEGECRIEGQTIEGDFLVGVAPSVLRWIPANYGKVFAEDRGGYHWTPMRVSGPLSHPTEDLSGRLIAAIPGAVIEKGVESAEQAERVIKEGVGGVLDALFGL